MRLLFLELKKILLLIVVLMTFSCQNEDIDGIWIGQYNILDTNGARSYHSLNTIIKFEGNKFTNHVLGKKSNEQVFEFRRKGSEIVPLSGSHGGFNIESVSEDSLVLSMPQMKEFKLVYKKHMKGFKVRPKEKSLNLTGKSYRNNETKQYYNFKSDSLVFVNSKIKGNWELSSIESINVLKLTVDDSINLMIIDSIIKDKMFLTRYSKDIDKVVLTEY